MLYDPDRPERMLLDEERYDAASPGLLWSAVLVGGLLPMAMGWWWVRRLRRTATADAPTFAMGVTVEQARPRWWNVRRPWVTLFPLDGPDARAVGRYPLMSGVVLGDIGAMAEVKGQVRDGGLVVARPAGSDAARGPLAARDACAPTRASTPSLAGHGSPHARPRRRGAGQPSRRRPRGRPRAGRADGRGGRAGRGRRQARRSAGGRLAAGREPRCPGATGTRPVSWRSSSG